MTPDERLEHLASEMEEQADVLEPHLDMNFWVEGKESLEDVNNVLRQCGTVICAGGFACLLPKLQEGGLSFKHRLPYYEGMYGLRALEKLFDLYPSEICYIFMPEAYSHLETVRPSDVVSHIRKVQEAKRREKKSLMELINEN